MTHFPDRQAFRNAVRVASLLSEAEYRFAKSMPTVPHSYTLVDTWDDPERFWECDEFIREHGYPHKFFRANFIYFDIDGHHYWNLPKPDRKVIKLINRAQKPYAKHDSFGPPSPEAQQLIEGRLREMTLGRVLEIGIPDTGPLPSAVPIDPSLYRCIDRRSMAISQAQYDLPKYEASFVRTCLSDHYRDGYDTILALWGAASHIPPAALDRIPWMLSPGGTAILMFHDDPGAQFSERDVPFHGFVVRKVINADLPQAECP